MAAVAAVDEENRNREAAPLQHRIYILPHMLIRKFTYSEHVLDFILFINCIGNENFRDKMDWFSVLEIYIYRIVNYNLYNVES